VKDKTRNATSIKQRHKSDQPFKDPFPLMLFHQKTREYLDGDAIFKIYNNGNSIGFD
jgi:hypothetical protein